MTVQVLLAPGTEGNLEKSLVNAIPFNEERYRACLSGEQLRGLRAMHPSGEEAVVTMLEGTRLVSAEARHTSTFNSRTVEADALRHRAEAGLVTDYLASMNDRALGFVTSRGRQVDLYFCDDGRSEIIEAKSSPEHEKVREAVAQLLDYAPWSPQPVTHLTALFPGSPDPDGVRFLHRLGIDCLYRTGGGRYLRGLAWCGALRSPLP